eukprot:886354-Rhodomonas_salina.1
MASASQDVVELRAYVARLEAALAFANAKNKDLMGVISNLYDSCVEKNYQVKILEAQFGTMRTGAGRATCVLGASDGEVGSHYGQ